MVAQNQGAAPSVSNSCFAERMSQRLGYALLGWLWLFWDSAQAGGKAQSARRGQLKLKPAARFAGTGARGLARRSVQPRVATASARRLGPVGMGVNRGWRGVAPWRRQAHIAGLSNTVVYSTLALRACSSVGVARRQRVGGRGGQSEHKLCVLISMILSRRFGSAGGLMFAPRTRPGARIRIGRRALWRA